MTVDAAREAAWAWVADVRDRREALYTDVAEGGRGLDEVFTTAADDDVIGSTKLLPVLDAVADRTKIEARRLLERLDIDERTRLTDIDADAQRVLADWAAGSG